MNINLNNNFNELVNESSNNEDLFVFPTSFTQERLWLLEQINDQTFSYVSPLVLQIQGYLKTAILEKALQELIDRHEILRTIFIALEDRPCQAIFPDYSLPLAIVDLQSISETEQNNKVHQIVKEEIYLPFNWEKSPPLRVKLLCLSPQSHILILAMHHIITDGWSMGILIDELSKIYYAFSQGQPSPFPDLSIQYGDFAQWQREWFTEETLQVHLQYWKKQLASAPPLVELPTDFPRPPIQTFQGAGYQVQLPSLLVEHLKNFSQSQGISLFTLFFTALKILLYKWTGQSDLVVGTVVAGRDRAEIEPLIGCFMNFLALRSQLTDEQTLLEVIKQESQTILDAYSHQECPFEKVVETINPKRHLNHNPVYNIALLLQNFPIPPFFDPSLTVEPFPISHNSASLDLRFVVEEDLAGTTFLGCEYSTDLFELTTIQRLLSYFQEILQALVEYPNQKLQDLSIITESEREQILIQWNQTHRDYPLNQTLHQLIESQVTKSPDAIAVVFEDQSLTYTQLNEQANQLAHYLVELGVKPNTLVGICVERSLEIVIGLLGILKAGGAYVPFDPDYPQERLAYMLEDSQVGILLTQDSLVPTLPRSQAHLVCLDRDWPVIAHEKVTNPPLLTTPENLAYVIYTSGSTGKPKGAMNTHKGIVNRLLWMQEAYSLDASDRILQKTPFSFDVSVWEFFWPLLTGARLIMAQPGGHRDSGYLVKIIQEQGITTLHFVPSMLQIFLEESAVCDCISLKRVICSGEALPFDLQERFFERLECELHNLYGPTEAAIDVSYWQCFPHHPLKKVPIGRPVANTQLYVLDSYLKPVPLGATGELHIGGVQVAQGYWNRPELTAEKFIQNPFDSHPSSKLYKTGDLCRYLPDGNLEYLGRIDHQVKIRGFRIELGEIESVLISHPDIRESLVMAREDQLGNKRLVAYLVSHLVPDRLHYVKSCQLEVNGRIHGIKSQDISIKGLGIADIAFKLAINEQVRIQILLPNQESPTWLSGRVIWYQDHHAGIQWTLTEEESVNVQQSYQFLQEELGIIAIVQRSLSQGLIKYLQDKLPDYMLPSTFVLLEQFPLTPNGKVDRRALPAPERVKWNDIREEIAPRNETEEKIAQVWQEVLGVSVSMNDNFFETGGNSLLATQVMSRLRKTYQMDLPLRILFEHSTVEALANYVTTLQWIGDDSSKTTTLQEDWETGEL